MIALLRVLCVAILLLAAGSARADGARFDLAGPTLDVRVTHAGATLPIAEAPSLSPGDELSIQAALPPGQSARYLLVAAFLRGATNPPPKTWFHAARTWDAKGSSGLRVVVPPGARQALVFLAPATGGDFKTLVDAVRGRPGAFVRASQDLDQASLDRSRLDAFLAAVHEIDRTDPAALKAASPLLARSLLIKLDADCLQKIPELQAACLTQGADSLVLNDGHGDSMVEDVTSGNPADLIQQIGAATPGGAAYFSPYIASVMDIARILDSMHTAHYQYIPALGVTKGETISLLLNSAPSFHNPLSVLVAALPAVEAPYAPSLHPVDPQAVYCLQAPDLVLPADGAPLVYATAYARGLALRFRNASGGWTELPVTGDASKGGLVVGGRDRDRLRLAGVADATVRGHWGFETYEGPTFRLQSQAGGRWRLADGPAVLTSGGDGAVRLQGGAAHCVSSVEVQPPSGPASPAKWAATAPDTLTVTVPPDSRRPGELTLVVRAYGEARPERVSARVFAPAGRLSGFLFHAGDAQGVLTGDHLADVASLALGDTVFRPGARAGPVGADGLTMVAAQPAAAAAPQAGAAVDAKVTFKDGRQADLQTTVQPPRPGAVLVDKTVQSAPGASGPIDLLDPDELPEHAVLTFSIRALPPATLTKTSKIEVATADGAFSTTLTAEDGLVLEDSQVGVGTLDPAKAFGPSAYGPLRFRLVDGAGPSDWRHLATLVRLPTLKSLTCRDKTCALNGSGLYLIEAVAPDAAFTHAAVAPEGFTGQSFATPRPVDGKLYLKLRDDPQVVNVAIFPVARHKSRRGAGVERSGRLEHHGRSGR